MSSESKSSTPRWRTYFEVGTTVVMLSLAGALLWQGQGRVGSASPRTRAPREMAPPTTPVPIGDSVVLGSTAAKVAIVEFSDYQCPSCGKAARDVMPAILREYVDTGKVAVVVKNLPLPIHTMALPAALAAQCASDQGKFAAAKDELFRLGPRIDPLEISNMIARIGVDKAAFEKCMTSDATAAKIAQEMAQAEAVSVNATPTFFLGSMQADGTVRVAKVILGARPVNEFREVLDRLLAESR